MNQIEGKVELFETAIGIPDLLVTVYEYPQNTKASFINTKLQLDFNSTSKAFSIEQLIKKDNDYRSFLKSISQLDEYNISAKILGSTITDTEGKFAIKLSENEYQIVDDDQHCFLITVMVPEYIEELHYKETHKISLPVPDLLRTVYYKFYQQQGFVSTCIKIKQSYLDYMSPLKPANSYKFLKQKLKKFTYTNSKSKFFANSSNQDAANFAVISGIRNLKNYHGQMTLTLAKKDLETLNLYLIKGEYEEVSINLTDFYELMHEKAYLQLKRVRKLYDEYKLRAVTSQLNQPDRLYQEVKSQLNQLYPHGNKFAQENKHQLEFCKIQKAYPDVWQENIHNHLYELIIKFIEKCISLKPEAKDEIFEYLDDCQSIKMYLVYLKKIQSRFNVDDALDEISHEINHLISSNFNFKSVQSFYYNFALMFDYKQDWEMAGSHGPDLDVYHLPRSQPKAFYTDVFDNDQKSVSKNAKARFRDVTLSNLKPVEAGEYQTSCVLPTRMRVSEFLSKITPVIMVALPMPNPADINEYWLKRYWQSIKNHLLIKTYSNNTELLEHIRNNIYHYLHKIWKNENHTRRYFELRDIVIKLPEPKLNQGNADFIVSATHETFFEKLVQRDLKKYTIKMPAPDLKNFKPARLYEIADLNDVLGFEANYAIFPLKKNIYVTYYMMQEYINDYLGLRDPDITSEIKTSEIQEILNDLMQKAKTEKDDIKLLNTMIKDRLDSPVEESSEVNILFDSILEPELSYDLQDVLQQDHA